MKNIFFIFISVLLLACHHSTSDKKAAINTCAVEQVSVHKTLYFTGTLEPLRESALVSTMGAVVDSMHYQYGQTIKKGAVVFTLNSAELQKQYNETLTDYLKAKDSYHIAQAKFTGTNDLWEAGLLSKNNYLSEKSNLNTTQVTLMQATQKLSEMLEKAGSDHDEKLSALSFEEFDKVRSALTSQHNLIQLKAPSNGVLLYPPKAANDSSDRITVGSTIKAGQVLALMGDLTGVRVEIDVPEVDISEIKLGMPATIHGLAFGKETLTGTLTAINAQASKNSNSSLPSFTATVEVTSLTVAQQALIRVGMSASVELAIEKTNKLLIPIAAISQEDDKNTVKIQTKQGKIISRTVTTGVIQGDKIVIESGLSAHDVIVL
jgi:HlyD family secretion protein